MTAGEGRLKWIGLCLEKTGSGTFGRAFLRTTHVIVHKYFNPFPQSKPAKQNNNISDGNSTCLHILFYHSNTKIKELQK